MPTQPAVIDKRLAPEFGAVVVHIQKPNGRIVEYHPPICALGEPDRLSLAPAQPGNIGKDRFSREIFISYGVDGFYFDQPGEYRIRAVYQGFGDLLIPSDTHRLRVATPQTKTADRLAQDYFTDVAGLSLYLQGSRSPYLEKGIDILREVASQIDDPVSGANINMALANGVSQPFFRADPKTGKIKQFAAADPKEALRMTEPVLKALQKKEKKSLNLAYGRVVRRRAEYHQAVGRPDLAQKELNTLRDDLATRGAHEPTLDRYAVMEDRIEDGGKKTSPKRRAAARASKKRAKPARKTKRKPASKSSRKSTRKAAPKTKRKPARKTARKTKRKPASKPARKSTRKSASKTKRKPARKTARKTKRKPARKPAR